MHLAAVLLAGERKHGASDMVLHFRRQAADGGYSFVEEFRHGSILVCPAFPVQNAASRIPSKLRHSLLASGALPPGAGFSVKLLLKRSPLPL